jgi:hypothetical protein
MAVLVAAVVAHQEQQRAGSEIRPSPLHRKEIMAGTALVGF